MDTPLDRAKRGRWLVCESNDRWLTASRRFVPDMVPPATQPVISTVAANDSAPLLPRRGRSVILWEITPENFLSACEGLASTSIHRSATLQIAAISGLTGGEQMVLSELGAAAMIRHPEHLPRLTCMIGAYFATWTHFLD